MSEKNLVEAIQRKKEELNRLVAFKKDLQDEEVCKKSCELDLLVVEYMKNYGRKTGNMENVRAII